MESGTRNLLIGLVAVALGILIVFNLGQEEPASVAADPSAPSIGSGNLTIFLFEDYQCSHCRDYTLGPNYAHLVDNWVDSGDVTLVFKHVAFVGPHSLSAAEASRCVAGMDAAAWPDFDHEAYRRQLEGVAPTPAALRGLADSMGLDLDAYDACVAQGDLDAVRANTEELAELGRGTPTIVIAGAAYDPNDTAAVDAAIQGALA